jgi:uncharacterized protein YbjT (DUF2867 family)
MRGEGELAVRAGFDNAFFVRPAVMFGPDDAFLTTLLKLLRKLPIYPMFGRGLTRWQPADVEDVAEAVVQLIRRPERHPTIFEFGGPRVYSYQQLLRAVGHWAGHRALACSGPVWRLARAVTGLRKPSGPHFTCNQVELMQIDTVASPEMPGFTELGISPHLIEETVQKCCGVRE